MSTRFKEIFNTISHRPYPLPSKPWVMKQVWRDLLFLHWKVNRDLLQSKIPYPLELDLFENQAWIGIVPFRMEGIRPRLFPALPWISAFPELNVRTYITYKGKPGVWFFSLDAGNPLAVEIARTFFHLPYFNAEMICEKKENQIQYFSKRKDKRGEDACLEMSYKPTSEIYFAQKGNLEHWLTERYSLYASNKKGNIFRGDIHHLPWSLQKAEANIIQNTMGIAHGITLPDEKPILHFIDKLEVGIYWLEKVFP